MADHPDRRFSDRQHSTSILPVYLRCLAEQAAWRYFTIISHPSYFGVLLFAVLDVICDQAGQVHHKQHLLIGGLKIYLQYFFNTL